VKIDLNLLEIEMLLFAAAPHDKQDLGRHYNSAKGKLSRARAELLAGEPEPASEKEAVGAAESGQVNLF
jgi:hypothetical protein